MLESFAFIGGQEFWIILVLVLVLFGGKKIPELMRGVGKGVGELQKGIEEGKRSFSSSISSTDDEPSADKPKSTA